MPLILPHTRLPSCQPALGDDDRDLSQSAANPTLYGEVPQPLRIKSFARLSRSTHTITIVFCPCDFSYRPVLR